jgi:N-methylhydantoinase A
MFGDSEWRECQVRRRQELASDEAVNGPAIVEDADTNIVLRPADRAVVLAGGHLMITIGGDAR